MERFSGSAQELFDLLKKEAELVFYQKKLTESEVVLDNFLEEYRDGDRETVLQKYQISAEDRLDWDALFDPTKNVLPREFPEFIQNYLKNDINEAELGNLTGALGATIDTYKRNPEPLNYMLDHDKFSPKEYFEDFFGSFNRNYSFLTIGAPVIRQKQLLALVKAGFIEFLAPEMTVERKDGTFLAFSKKATEQSYSCKNLIEARLPATSFERTTNTLLIQMRKKGYITPHQVEIEGKNILLEHCKSVVKHIR